MKGLQLELFGDLVLALVRDDMEGYPPYADADDPAPKETSTDRYWWYMNRWAENCAVYARMWGLY